MKKIYVPNEFMFSHCGAPSAHCERFFGRPERRWVDGGEVLARVRVAGREAVYRSSALERRCAGWLEVARADCDSVLHALRTGHTPKGSEPPVYVILSD